MTTITYLDHQGNARSLDVAEGDSVMLGAVNHDLDGIEAYCSGACACATCHVYVNEAWLDKLPPIAEKEQNMLKFVMDRRPNSRLSCQIKVSAELDGLIVTTPEYQI